MLHTQMYSSSTSLILKQLFRFAGINYNLVSRLSKVSIEVDDKVSERIENQELKIRKHPGIIKIKSVKLPDNIKKAIAVVLGDTSKKQLLKECEAFSRYLHSRQPPFDKNTLLSKASSIKQEVEDSFNVNEELLSEEEHIHYTELIQNQVNTILKQRMYNWQPIIYSRYKGLQYLFTRSVPEYAVMMQIFKEIQLEDNFKPRTLFDFGSGIGTVLWAGYETWGKSLKEFFCVDSSKDMNCLSEDLLKLSYKEIENKLFYRQFLPAANNPSYDIVVSAYSLLELPSTSSRLDAITKLWNKTNKYLVLVEQGTTAGFKVISEARDHILEVNKEKFHIFSPCPHELNCPRISRGGNIPCHFQISYHTYPQKEQIRKELFSYVVFKKGTKNSDDAAWPRIVKPVLCRSRHVICRLCTSTGTLQEIIITPTKHGRMPYKCARRSNWGDRLPFNITNIVSENAEDEKPLSED